jgi:hypothetical protein
MAKYNLKRIDLYVPQYRTNAIITIDEDYSSGQPHLVGRYEKGGYKGQKDVAAAIPPDWTDQDLAELIFLPLKPRADRNWLRRGKFRQPTTHHRTCFASGRVRSRLDENARASSAAQGAAWPNLIFAVA